MILGRTLALQEELYWNIVFKYIELALVGKHALWTAAHTDILREIQGFLLFWILITTISSLKSTQLSSLHCCSVLCAWIIQHCSLSAPVVYCMVKNQWRERLSAWEQGLFSMPAARRVSYVRGRGWGHRHPLHDISCRFTIMCAPHSYTHFLCLISWPMAQFLTRIMFTSIFLSLYLVVLLSFSSCVFISHQSSFNR